LERLDGSQAPVGRAGGKNLDDGKAFLFDLAGEAFLIAAFAFLILGTESTATRSA
jgi:hypothetical protein